MRTEIQNRLYQLCIAGTFATVTYDAVTKLATKSEATTVPATTSSDAVPAGLQEPIEWKDSGTTENGEKVYYDASEAYAYWNDGTDWQITIKGDVGGSPTNYFKVQDYPDTITLIKDGVSDSVVSYTGLDSLSRPQYENATEEVRFQRTYRDEWKAFFHQAAGPSLSVLSSEYLPPKDGWDGGLSLAYTIPTDQYVGVGTFSGTIVESSAVIPAVLDIPHVVVNEVSGTLTRSVKAGARSSNASMENWIFEARLKFKNEVSVDYFLKNELKMVSFVKDNERVTAVSTGFPVVQPPRQKPHNGTEMVITFSVNTRR